MPITMPRRSRTRAAGRGSVVVLAAALLLPSAFSSARAEGSSGDAPGNGLRTVSFHGYRLEIPRQWRVVDLTAEPHACLRFDTPAVYLGHAGDQRACPAHLIGGAPGLHLEALDAHSLAATRPTLTVRPSDDVQAVRLPSRGPVSVAVEGAGVLVTSVYGETSAALVQTILAGAAVLPDAHPGLVGSFPPAQEAPVVGVSVPGTYLGKGFDACTAPSQTVMDAWRASSDYASVGVYIGGVSRGCSQANLTAAWVSRQVSSGWHLVATYVGRQAPCTNFQNRISYDVSTAAAQGRAEASDAVAKASALGMVAPSTVYSDMEGYDNTNASCVAAVLSYLSGWTYALHAQAYEAGVYSSASSGIHDLSAHHGSSNYHRPDDIWIAWWNSLADVDGGTYVPDAQWTNHQRIHQYAGNVTESHGGYTVQIDRDFLDVSSAVSPPRGCPTDLNFAAYPLVKRGDQGRLVTAAQCLLARSGFSPGVATGIFGWRAAAAARAFKASVGLASDDATLRRWAWTALTSAGPTKFLDSGSRGSRVRKVQRALTARLQRTVDISGKYDAATRRAVLAYQGAVGMNQTGTVGPVTWTALHAGR